MKRILGTLLSFSRKERNGMLVLFCLLLLLLAAQLLAGRLFPGPRVNFSAFEHDAKWMETAVSFPPDSTNAKPPPSNNAGPPHSTNAEKKAGKQRWERPDSRQVNDFPEAAQSNDAPELFYFDPNTASRKELLKLGLRPKIAAILLNYREAGGRFRSKEDLKKVYGLRESVYQKLLPFVQIEALSAVGSKARPVGEGAPPIRRRDFSCVEVEINSADSAAFLPLRGIGPVLSARIVKYRQRLGGFHSADQLLEVYGMDTVSFHEFRDCLRADSALIRKINLNKAVYNELRQLPYWSPKQIRIVLNYREQHGPFQGISALYNIRALEDGTIQKVMPYLSLK